MACCCGPADPCTVCASKFMQVDINITVPPAALFIGRSCQCQNSISVNESFVLPLLPPGAPTAFLLGGRWGYQDDNHICRIWASEWPCTNVVTTAFSVQIAFGLWASGNTSGCNFGDSGTYQCALVGPTDPRWATHLRGINNYSNTLGAYLVDHPTQGTNPRCLVGTKTYPWLYGDVRGNYWNFGTFTITFF